MADLRRSIDEGAEELGAAVDDGLPSTPGELRAELPAELDELTGAGGPFDSVESVVAETPLSGVLGRIEQ